MRRKHLHSKWQASKIRKNKFTYLGSNISSTESDVNICLAKEWPAINRLLIIWISDLSDKIKWDFFQAVAVGWVYGISTFVGYLMPNPFLCK